MIVYTVGNSKIELGYISREMAPHTKLVATNIYYHVQLLDSRNTVQIKNIYINIILLYNF